MFLTDDWKQYGIALLNYGYIQTMLTWNQGKEQGNSLYGDINLSQRHFVGWGIYGHIVYLCKWKRINVNVTYAQNMCGITNKLTEIVWGGGQ